MPTWTNPAWYAHCWIFCLSQFGMPTTGLGVKLGMHTAQLTERSKDTCKYKLSRAFSLVSLSSAKASHRPACLSLDVFLVALRHFRFPLDRWVSSTSVIMTLVFVSGCSPEFEGVFPAVSCCMIHQLVTACCLHPQFCGVLPVLHKLCFISHNFIMSQTFGVPTNWRIFGFNAALCWNDLLLFLHYFTDYSLCQQIMSDLCAKNFKCKGQNGKRAFGPGAFKEVAISKSFYLSYGHF